jgi:transcriptional regulator GlxA family with amidase domain
MGNRGSVRDGNLYSSGGVSDGIQVALALVAEDCGEAFARRVIKSLSSQA